MPVMLDILHDYYDYVLVDKTWNEINNKNYYHPFLFWNKKFTDMGLLPQYKYKKTKNIFGNYMFVYKKKELKIIRDLPFTRIITDDFPAEKYSSRKYATRHYSHWGQRKLLLSEIEFLNVFYKKYDKKFKNIIVIYVGSAPGTHIIYLIKLFPDVKFILYDPRDFNKNLHTHKNITIHQQYFTNECAEKQLNNIKKKSTALLFISDIRGDNANLTQKEIEINVKNDHKLQYEWVKILNPELSMLKFRLPWDTEKTTYLKGDIYLQAYAPLSSTETRLLVEKNAPDMEYDNKKYEEQLFYFNKYYREAEFSNILSDTNIKHKKGLTDKYDNVAEINILHDYLKFNSQSTDDIKESIINMSDEISKTMSDNRGLYTIQPLNNEKNLLMKKIISKGLVPKVKINTYNYNLYVMPIMPKLEKLGLLKSYKEL
jgi:hypothetical protein